MKMMKREWKVSSYGSAIGTSGVRGGKLQTLLNNLERDDWTVYKLTSNELGEVMQIISFRMVRGNESKT